jgi:DNA-binding response OmpR family regulator
MSLEIVQIIEDEPLHARLLDHSLRQARYRTNVAGDGVTGLADVQRLHPSLVLLDLMLPRMSGQEVCGHIRKDAATSQIPIILVSALGSEEDRIAGIKMGADDYLTKPFSPREVISCVRSVLQRSREHTPFPSSDNDSVRAIDDHCLNVSLRGKQLTVSRDEWKVLRLLTTRSGQIVTVEELVSLIWGDREPTRDRQVRSLVQTLKTKLENSFAGSIEILPTIGYRSIASTSDAASGEALSTGSDGAARCSARVPPHSSVNSSFDEGGSCCSKG